VTLRIAFLGDIYTGLSKIQVGESLGNALHACDFVIANLEGPVVEGDANNSTIKGTYLSNTRHTIEVLQSLHVTHVSLANNHIYDWGESAVETTKTILKDAGIEWLGAGQYDQIKTAVTVLKKERDEVSLISATTSLIESVEATPAVEGCLTFDSQIFFDLKDKQIKKSQCNVLYVHWGLTNYAYPTPRQRDLAKGWSEDGFDAIVGHHPHVRQGYELFGGDMVFYSLGNSVFGNYYRKGKKVSISKRNTTGLLLILSVSEQEIKSREILVTHHPVGGGRLDLIKKIENNSLWLRAHSIPFLLSKKNYSLFFKVYVLMRLAKRTAYWINPRNLWISRGSLASNFRSLLHIVSGR
jgi:hypothetical protein